MYKYLYNIIYFQISFSSPLPLASPSPPHLTFILPFASSSSGQSFFLITKKIMKEKKKITCTRSEKLVGKFLFSNKKKRRKIFGKNWSKNKKQRKKIILDKKNMEKANFIENVKLQNQKKFTSKFKTLEHFGTHKKKNPHILD